MEALPQHAQTGFRDEYISHFWEDPSGAPVTVSRFGAGKQGSSTSMHGRSIPTYAEGLALGLKPKFTNPIDMTLHYGNSISKYIGSMEILKAENKGKSNRRVYFRLK